MTDDEDADNTIERYKYLLAWQRGQSDVRLAKSEAKHAALVKGLDGLSLYTPDGAAALGGELGEWWLSAVEVHALFDEHGETA